jgi:3-oxoacyl-[acyl-carrier-protein] synthase-3
MVVSEFKNIEISGIAVAVPTNIVPISSYNEAFGEDVVAKFVEMAGVKTVHRANPEQTASDLGFEAAKELIIKCNIDVSDIGILIFVTQNGSKGSLQLHFNSQRLNLSKNAVV